MNKLIVANTTTSSDLLYASGFKAPDEFIFFSINNTPSIILNSLEYGRGKKEAKHGVSVLLNTEFLGKEINQKNREEQLIELSQKLNVLSWDVPNNFPISYADALRKQKIEISYDSECFFPERECKNKEEIAYVKDAMSITENAFELVKKILKESDIRTNNKLFWNDTPLTSEAIRAEINVMFIQNEYFASDTIIAGGVHGADPHNIGTGQLYAHQPIVCDIFPRSLKTGYWGDMTRTFVKGNAPKIVKKAFTAVKEARDATKKIIKAGVLASDVHLLAIDILENHNFKTEFKNGVNVGFIHGLGHGVGLDIHELPRLSKRNEMPLKAGNIITIEPGLYYPEWGGIRLEDIAVVTEQGIECFNTFETILEIQ